MFMRVACSVSLLLAACSFDGSGLDPRARDIDGGQPDAGLFPGDDGGGIARSIRHDTAADFAAAGAVLEAAQVEAWGAVGPAPQVVGALRARGVDKRMFTEVEDIDWTALHAETGGGSSLMTPTPLPIVGSTPVGVGITRTTNWTLWLEGEVWLEPGIHRWQLDVDDDGAVDIQAPGDVFRQVVAGDFDAEGFGTFRAPTVGWYPIRIALSQGAGSAGLALLHQGPSDATATPLPAYRLRAASGPAGLLAQGFDDRRLFEPRAAALHADDALALDLGTAAPRGLGIADGDTFAIRWTGQVRIDLAGRYTVRVASDDGHRVTVDGARVLDFWTDEKETRTGDVELDVGWHDLAIDLRENATSAAIDVSITAGPELVGRIPAARLRPTLVRTARVGGGRRAENLAIPDGDSQGARSAISVEAPTESVVDHVDVTVEVSHASLPDLEIALRAPNGTERVLAPAGTLRAATFAIESDALAGISAGGAWSVIVRDRAANVLAGVVVEATLAVHYRGGESPVATAARYQSPPLDLGTVVGFDAVVWTARAPQGSSVAVRMRTCATADACADEEWSEVLANGERPLLPPRRFAQYRVELATSGDAVPALDSIELRYRAAD